MNRFDWKWYLKDIKQDKPVKVFTTFSCGGGSSMGYKRAGFEVIGNVEIDPKMNAMYCKNHHPKYNYCIDLREFNKLDDLPDAQVKAFRLADNRVAELAVWDEDLLKQEMAKAIDIDLSDYGFDPEVIDRIVQEDIGIKKHRCPRCGCEWTIKEV